MIHFNTFKKYYKSFYNSTYSCDFLFHHNKTSKTVYEFCVYSDGITDIYRIIDQYRKAEFRINLFNYQKREQYALIYDEQKNFTRNLYKFIYGL